MEKYIIALLVLIAVAATVSVFIYIRKRKAFLMTDLEKTDKKQQHSSPDSYYFYKLIIYVKLDYKFQ